MQEYPEYIQREEKGEDSSSRTAEHKKQSIKQPNRPIIPKVRQTEIPEKEFAEPFRVVGKKNNDLANEKLAQNLSTLEDVENQQSEGEQSELVTISTSENIDQLCNSGREPKLSPLARNSKNFQRQDTNLTTGSGTATKQEEDEQQKRTESPNRQLGVKSLAKMNKKEKKAYEARKAKHEQLVEQTKLEKERKAAADILAAEQQKREEQERARRFEEEQQRKKLEEQRAAKRLAQYQQQQAQKLQALQLAKTSPKKTKEESDKEGDKTPISNEDEILQQVSWSSAAAKRSQNIEPKIKAKLQDNQSKPITEIKRQEREITITKSTEISSGAVKGISVKPLQPELSKTENSEKEAEKLVGKFAFEKNKGEDKLSKSIAKEYSSQPINQSDNKLFKVKPESEQIRLWFQSENKAESKIPGKKETSTSRIIQHDKNQESEIRPRDLRHMAANQQISSQAVYQKKDKSKTFQVKQQPIMGEGLNSGDAKEQYDCDTSEEGEIYHKEGKDDFFAKNPYRSNPNRRSPQKLGQSRQNAEFGGIKSYGHQLSGNDRYERGFDKHETYQRQERDFDYNKAYEKPPHYRLSGQYSKTNSSNQYESHHNRYPGSNTFQSSYGSQIRRKNDTDHYPRQPDEKYSQQYAFGSRGRGQKYNGFQHSRQYSGSFLESSERQSNFRQKDDFYRQKIQHYGKQSKHDYYEYGDESAEDAYDEEHDQYGYEEKPSDGFQKAGQASFSYYQQPQRRQFTSRKEFESHYSANESYEQRYSNTQFSRKQFQEESRFAQYQASQQAKLQKSNLSKHIPSKVENYGDQKRNEMYSKWSIKKESDPLQKRNQDQAGVKQIMITQNSGQPAINEQEVMTYKPVFKQDQGTNSQQSQVLFSQPVTQPSQVEFDREMDELNSCFNQEPEQLETISDSTPTHVEREKSPKKNYFSAFKRIQHIFSNNNTVPNVDDAQQDDQQQLGSNSVFGGSLGLFGGPNVGEFYGSRNSQPPSTLFSRQYPSQEQAYSQDMYTPQMSQQPQYTRPEQAQPTFHQYQGGFMQGQMEQPNSMEALRMNSRPLQQIQGQELQQRTSFFATQPKTMQQSQANQQPNSFKQIDFQWKKLKPYNSGGLASKLQLRPEMQEKEQTMPGEQQDSQTQFLNQKLGQVNQDQRQSDLDKSSEEKLGSDNLDNTF